MRPIKLSTKYENGPTLIWEKRMRNLGEKNENDSDHISWRSDY